MKKISLEDKKLRTQINGKYNGISSAYCCTYFNIIMHVYRNCQVLSEQTSDSSTFRNAACLLKYVLSCEQRFFIFVSGLARLGFTAVIHAELLDLPR
jgi:hypothetical protein